MSAVEEPAPEPDFAHGPAMMALSEKRRRFVLAMASDPFGTLASWGKAAGYSDVKGGAKIRAHEAMHDPKVQQAVLEVAKQTLGVRGPVLAANALIEIVQDKKHPQHLKAVEMLLNRTGMAEKQLIEVTHHHQLSPDEMLARVQFLQAKYNLPPSFDLMAAPKAIEWQPPEQESDDGAAEDGPVIEDKD
jgi:hypothetical protein